MTMPISTIDKPIVQPAWRRSLRDTVDRLDDLLAILGLEARQVGASEAAAATFPLRVPRAFVARMRPGDPADPLLRQVLPADLETRSVAGFVTDPLAERSVSPSPGVLHKFAGRVLWITTGACAVHCRYCFRRHFPYEDHQAWSDDWSEALAQVAADASVREVILSGGDPLVVADHRLARLVAALGDIPHLERLRIHTRTPVVLPDRVDEGLVAWLGATRLQTVIVLHANHAREIDSEVGAAFSRLQATGATLLNQAVLLRGVNDDADALVGLSETLFRHGVLPYYLHQLDPVDGAAHFDVTDAEARALMRAVSRRLPGYLVPRLVREIPGAGAKVPLDLRFES